MLEKNKKFCINKDLINSKKNIILITLDAFNFHIFENNIDFLPNFKKLKKTGIYFNNAFSIGPMTPFSFPGIIGSIYPYSYGIGISENIETIDSILKKQGYNTAFINEAQGFLTSFFGYCKDFDYYKDFLEYSYDKIDRNFLKDNLSQSKNQSGSRERRFLIKIHNILGDEPKKFINFLTTYLSNNYDKYKNRKLLHEYFCTGILDFLTNKFKSPQFLWIHTIVNHLPYLPPDTNNIPERKINYLNCRGISRFLNYNTAQKLKYVFTESLITTDNLIGKIMECMNENNLLNDSIMIITSDHGEEFMENGYFGHGVESSSDTLLRIPIIFYCPNIFKNKVISEPVSTLDILPTVTDILNINGSINAQGLSLKKLLLNDSDDENIREKFIFRPLFSESWQYRNKLNRSPGYKSKDRIFTIRYYKYKLKVRQMIDDNDILNERYMLMNWVENRRLLINKNKILFNELKTMLDKHLTEQIMN